MNDVEFPPADIAGAAASIGLQIPAECLPGVAANLAALAEHLRNVEAHERTA